MNSWTEYDPQFVRRRYNRLASFYVFLEWLFWIPRGIRPRAVTRLSLQPGDRVLEVGCRTGRNLSYLSRAVGPDGRVYGIDISEGMLAKAREACEKDVMLDAKALSGWLGRVLYPLAAWTLKLTVLGSPDIDELKDLEALTGQVEVEELQFGTYFIARVVKPAVDQ